MANPDDKGQAELVADTDGQGKVRIDGSYLASVLKACGGMVELSLTNGYSPMLFNQNGYKLVVMPMLTAESQSKGEQEAEAEQEPETTETVEPEVEVIEPAAEKPKGKRSRKAKEAVTV